MPLPRWLARFNRRWVNPGAVERGSWPVVTHVGRSSGRTYRTPLGAHRVDDGWMFMLNYGSHSDWVRNILATGEATLDVDGETIALDRPRLVSQDEAWDLLPDDTPRLPVFVRLQEYLLMQEPAS